MSVKSSFAGLGTAARAFELLEEEFGVTRGDLQRSVIDDAIQRQKVAAVMRGLDVPGEVSLDQIVTREDKTLQFLCEWMGVKFPGAKLLQEALLKAEAEWGVISIHDRVIPAGLGLAQLFAGFYAFNAVRNEQREVPIKLGHPANEEWWRKDKDVQHLPTELSVIRQDLAAVMQPADLLGRPFYLSLDDQMAWAREQGGDGITSAEEIGYLAFRRAYEYNLPPWAAGSCRTRNTYGSARSLLVDWYAFVGFRVAYYDRGARWFVGVLPRKSLVLGR